MLARSLRSILLVAGAFVPARGQDGLFEEIGDPNLRVRFLPNELERDEAEKLVVNFRSARQSFVELLQVDPILDKLTVQVRVRPGVNRFYYTNGSDQLFIDFTNPNQFRPLADLDYRMWRIALDAYAQLWTYRHLDSMAGLDPRFVDGLSEYLWYRLEEQGITGRPAVEPTGAGQFWLKVDQLFTSDVLSWVLNTLDAEHFHGWQLGSILRERLKDATEEPQAAELVDMIAPAQDLFSLEEYEPSGTLAPAVTLRMSRGALFNGVRLLDVEGPQLSAADRVRDFESAYLTVIRTYPDRDLASVPPKLNDVEMWQLYGEFRARVERCRDNLDFFLVMREFFARFRDRWVCVITDQGAPLWQGVQGMSLVDVQGRPFVAAVREDGAPYQAGVRPGMELLRIDGQPASVVRRSLEQYFSSASSCSSPQEFGARALNMLLTGAADTHVALTFRTPEGTDMEIACVRGAPSAGGTAAGSGTPDAAKEAPKDGAAAPPSPPPMPEFLHGSVRDDGVAVIKIDVFAPQVVAAYGQLLDQYRAQSVRGLVVDLRGNSLGLLQASMPTLSLLLESDVTLGEMATRVTSEAPGNVSTQPIVVRPIPAVTGFHGPCALLVDAWTSGAAEMFALGFKMANRGPVVGETTAGAANLRMEGEWPFLTLASSGIRMSLTQSVVLLRDGEPLQSRGVTPTLVAGPTASGLAAGKDEVLEAAVAQLLIPR